jgi:hypothetical protein
MRKTLKNITLALASITLTLAVAESVIRIVDPWSENVTLERPFFLEHDPELGWINKKSERGKGRAKPWLDETYIKINNNGLRGKEYPYIKPRGKTRVILLGDSITFGYGLNKEDTFAYMLQEKAPEKIEYINAGTIGYGTDQEYLFYKKEISKYEADFLVVLFSGGDVFDNTTSIRYGANKPYFKLVEGQLKLFNVPVPEKTSAKDTLLENKPIGKFLFDSSALYRFLFFKFVDLNSIYDTTIKETDIFEGMKTTSAIISALKAETSRKSQMLIFVAIPQKDWLEQDFKTPHEGTLRTMAMAGVHVLDLWVPFKENLNEGLFLKDDITHLTRRGNELVAREISRMIQSIKSETTSR